MPVTFNGPTRRITITSGSSIIDVKTDIYSAWKNWVKISDNAKYMAALRVVGGDSLSVNQSLDGYFFLINDWKLVPPPDSGSNDIEINGNLFVDGGGNIFDASGSGTRLAKISLSSKALVNDFSGSVTVGSIQSVQTASYVQYVASPVTASLLSGSSISASLSPIQETMLLEMYRLLGLDPTRPLIVSSGSRLSGPEITQSIFISDSKYIAQRI